MKPKLLLTTIAAALACVAGPAAAERPLDAKIRAAVAAGELSGLHCAHVVHKGVVLAETCFKGRDERWGRPLGVREHTPETLHDVRSVTKSVVGLLYGIALVEGRAPLVHESLLKHFPEYADLAADPARKEILVAHALSMRMGVQWNENLPYTDPNNSEIAMERAKDRYRYVLSRPLIAAPGSAWTYNGGAVAVLARLIERGTGKRIDEYAEEKLFRPLGITTYEWIKGADGAPSAASGLRLSIRDLAKIGALVLQDGRWRGRAVVSKKWLLASFIPRSDLKNGLRYGYLWWLAPKSMGEKPAWVGAFGNGGQRLMIQPARDLIVAVSAGGYNKADAWRISVALIEKFVAPALRK